MHHASEQKEDMTEEQFDLVARLLRSKEPAISGVRLVIFGGLRNAEAARQVGVNAPALHRSVVRFKTLHKEIEAAYKK